VRHAVVHLTEWQTVTAREVPELEGLFFQSSTDRLLVERLADRRMVHVRELRDGLEIRTTSFVGSLSVGPLTIHVQPKLEAGAFAALIGYAMGLPRLELLTEHAAPLTAPSFQDLLIASLAEETTRLLARGIHRQYKAQEASLESPRGRLLFGALARQGPSTAVTLPCRFHERDEDVLPNQVLLAGVRLGAQLAIDRGVRRHAMRAAAALSERVQTVPLTAFTMARLERARSRLLDAYQPAFALIRLLMGGQGVSTHEAEESFPLPGFLFDMNVLFQNALGRFLTESLDDTHVSQQHHLSDFFAYQRSFNPRRKRTPTPRPDFVLQRKGRIVAIADAKYRDLWEQDLGRDMLYQLAIYALSQEHCRAATILYPARDPEAREARVSINDPTTGLPRAEVHLRPVDVGYLAQMVRARRDAVTERRRAAYARRLAFGTE
jgi:5-methylcytosine-specific restriction enzyme subunit McrC